MEFRLNKIDTDIRRKLAEETKDDKVHRKQKISIDNKMKKPFVEHKTEDEQKEKEKKFLTIEGIKYEKKIIEVKAEIVEGFQGQASKGNHIDTKK